MDMTTVYSLQCSAFSNSCHSDSLEDVLQWIREQAPNLSKRTIITIRIEEIPTDLWLAYPPFEGFKYNGQADAPGSD